MISSLFPGFLAAGAVLAAAPVVLHLLARKPPGRRPLPTARFLREHAHTLLRLQSRPTDSRLLLVRIAFALALGAAFAGVTWTPERIGSARVVLLDAGADPLADWDVSRELARRAAAERTGAAPSIVLAYGLDDGLRVLVADELDDLERGSRPSTAEDGLRALRTGVLSGTGVREAEATWVMRPTWRAWSPGVGLLRPVLWPARVRVLPVPSLSATDPMAGAPELFDRTARVLAAEDADPLPRALDALGVNVVSWDDLGGSDSDLSFADAPAGDQLRALVDRARAGATIVLSGRLTGRVPGLPWLLDAAGGRGSGRIVLADATHLGWSVIREGGVPAPGASVVAVFEDATPAAAAAPVGEGCLVYLAASLRDPALTGSPAYPTLVDALARGCEPMDGGDAPLDRGALHALERPDLATLVDVGAMAAAEGAPLTRWFALLVLLLFGLEVGLTRERRA